MNTKTMTAIAAVAFATAALTGCTSTSEAAAPKIELPAGLPDAVDKATAEKALNSNTPFLYGAADTHSDYACHSYLLVPTDGEAVSWTMNESGAAPTAGRRLDVVTDQYGCSSSLDIDIPRPTPPVIPPVEDVDLDAQHFAREYDRVPFIVGQPPVGGTDGREVCNTYIVMPSGRTWFLNAAGAPPFEGAVLSREEKLEGCRPVPDPLK